MGILTSFQQWIIGSSYVSSAVIYGWIEYIKGIKSGMEFLLLFFGLATGWAIWKARQTEQATAKIKQKIAEQELHELSEKHEQNTLEKAYKNEHIKFD